ncbi:MAG: hypothetical protein ACTSRG_21870 [Candidatus Helarchaeota archaeon]
MVPKIFIQNSKTLLECNKFVKFKSEKIPLLFYDKELINAICEIILNRYNKIITSYDLTGMRGNLLYATHRKIDIYYKFSKYFKKKNLHTYFKEFCEYFRIDPILENGINFIIKNKTEYVLISNNYYKYKNIKTDISGMLLNDIRFNIKFDEKIDRIKSIEKIIKYYKNNEETLNEYEFLENGREVSITNYMNNIITKIYEENIDFIKFFTIYVTNKKHEKENIKSVISMRDDHIKVYCNNKEKDFFSESDYLKALCDVSETKYNFTIKINILDSPTTPFITISNIFFSPNFTHNFTHNFTQTIPTSSHNNTNITPRQYQYHANIITNEIILTSLKLFY